MSNCFVSRRPITVGRKSLLIVLLLSTAACSSSPSAPTEPVVTTLAPGASTIDGRFELKFNRVTADSRCPGDAICISAGDAQVEIELDGFGPRRQAELWLVDPAKRSVEYGGYTVTFEALTPYPFVSLGPIAPGAYRATFKISNE